MSLKTWQGTHGTCESFAEAIEREGFRAGTGFGGPGVYLWAIDSIPDRAIALAQRWHKLSTLKGGYRMAKNRACVVFVAEFDCDADHTLDLATVKAQETLDRSVRAFNQSKLPPSPKDAMAMAVGALVRQIEENGHSVELLTLSVPIPGRPDMELYDGLSVSPTALIIRRRIGEIRLAGRV